MEQYYKTVIFNTSHCVTNKMFKCLIQIRIIMLTIEKELFLI